MASSPNPNRRFAIAILVMIVASLAPVPAWMTGPLGGAVTQLVVPISEPLARLRGLVRPAEREGASDDPVVRELEEALLQAHARIANLESRVATLVRQIEEFQAGYAADAAATFRLLKARRAAEPAAGRARTFKINAGRTSGVEAGVVAVANVYQLVGRVTDADNLTATITPITDPGSGPLQAVILVAGTNIETGLVGALKPEGDGTLTGLFEDQGIAVGDPVRLRDSAWGESHDGLLIGYVSAVADADQAPLFKRVVVTPTIPVEDVGEVMLRIPREPGDNAMTDRAEDDS